MTRAALLLAVIGSLVVGAAHLGVAWVAHESRPSVVAH
jgi:hypothetical protein